MIRWLKTLAPLALILLGAVAAFAMFMSRTKPETRVPESVPQLVRVETVHPTDITITVNSQGTVRPRTESVLLAEISGKVIEVAPSFVSGGFFEHGQTLLRIDARDYRQAIVQAEAQVAQADLRLARVDAEAELAREDWEDLGEGEALPLTRHDLQIAEAQTAAGAARAMLQRAERDHERTTIKAPYAGRVREKNVDLGQFVSRGTPLATVYAVDFAEILLPLPDDDLAFLDLPLAYRGDRERLGPEVVLRARFAGKVREWRGHIVRTEGEIDPRSRMVHAVARVKNPYARSEDPDRAPLAAGLFVEAEIQGVTAKGVVRIPRSALRNGDRVLIVDDEDRLRFRDVEVLRNSRDEVIVRSGLADGERLCLSSLAAVTDGMRVRTVEEAG